VIVTRGPVFRQRILEDGEEGSDAPRREFDCLDVVFVEEQLFLGIDEAEPIDGIADRVERQVAMVGVLRNLDASSER